MIGLVLLIGAGYARAEVSASDAQVGTEDTVASRVQLTPLNPESDRYAFDLIGLHQETLHCLHETEWSQNQWQRVFAVYVGTDVNSTESDIPPVLGAYHVEKDCIRFQPKFDLQPGLIYTAVFQSANLPACARGQETPSELLVHHYHIPKVVTTPTTTVSTVYPTSDVLPENLLKFYLTFSASMSSGDVYQHITLFDDQGQVVELPFLELDQELWDPTQTRLTLLLDPGRIKRDLKPNQDVGPPLKPGHAYTLKIDTGWHDANDLPLADSYEKTFRVAPFDKTHPDPNQWQLTLPKAGTSVPLQITFNEPMDYALAQRCITVKDPVGKTILGDIELSNQETVWRLVPDEPWQGGAYHLRIATVLEDLAGNSVGRLFEIDLTESSIPEDIPDFVALTFSIE